MPSSKMKYCARLCTWRLLIAVNMTYIDEYSIHIVVFQIFIKNLVLWNLILDSVCSKNLASDGVHGRKKLAITKRPVEVEL